MTMSEFNANRPPDKELRAGKVGAALWKSETVRDDRTVIEWSVKVEKRYKDRQGDEWRSSNYYFPSELADLEIVVRRAHEFCRLREDAGAAAGTDVSAGDNPF
jgi:hypothetical protein